MIGIIFFFSPAFLGILFHFCIDKTARLKYNSRVLGTRRKTGSWVR